MVSVFRVVITDKRIQDKDCGTSLLYNVLASHLVLFKDKIFVLLLITNVGWTGW